MDKIKKRIWFILFVGVSGLLSLSFIESRMSDAINQSLNIPSPQLLEVVKGDSLNRILFNLDQQDLIDRNIWLRAYVKVFLKEQKVHVGAYELTPGTSLSALVEDVVMGNVKQFEITLIEGLTWRDWKKAITDSPAIVNDLNEEALIKELSLEGESIEGWLMPDTYSVIWGTSATEFVTRIHKEMQAYLEQQWQDRMPLLPLESPYEALILASIIEKETGRASERPLIAGVFSNRLEQGMKLQTDPTIIYGIGEDFDGNLTRKHMRQATPYNTYIIKRLPPTPIAMPGKASIEATLNPESTEALYFVAKGDGSHQFSKTLEEHNAAVRKYQLGIN